MRCYFARVKGPLTSGQKYASLFVDFVGSEEGQEIIRNYGKDLYGEAMYNDAAYARQYE